MSEYEYNAFYVQRYGVTISYYSLVSLERGRRTLVRYVASALSASDRLRAYVFDTARAHAATWRGQSGT